MMDLSQKTCGQDVIQVAVGENESLGLRREHCLNKEKRKRLFSTFTSRRLITLPTHYYL